ncbi:MAG: hypothetical protein HY876_08590 [Coriobacteriales bacterium]|nr:hypothetical protein [Coriobacteriales bacterium]
MNVTKDSSTESAYREGLGYGGQSVAVAVASALLLFTVVGLVASRTSVRLGSASWGTSRGVAIGVPASQARALEPVVQTIDAPQLNGDSLNGSFMLTVPARREVLVDIGVPVSCPGGGKSTAILIPALEPGHHVLNVGLHEIVVTAVEE